MVPITNYTSEYEKLRKQYIEVIDSATLKKYEILKRAEQLSRKIYGHRYSLDKLCKDFEVPRTTAKRILSLNKANKTTWQLIKEKKISVFRVAYILSTKDVTFQDDIIQMSIKDNLSTYDIKKLKTRSYNALVDSRLKIAVQKGFSRRYVADQKFVEAINRLDSFMDLDPNTLADTNKKKIKKLLTKLKDDIQRYIDKL